MQEITKLETNAVTSMSDFVQIKDEQVYTTSRIVAEKFGKRHDNVIRDIEAAISTINDAQVIENKDFLKIEEIKNDYFTESSYVDSLGRTYKEYLITEDGLALLVMGFTGEKAFSVKLKFISEFKRMKEYIRTLEANPIERILANSTNQLETARAITQMLEIEAKKQEVLNTEVKQLTSTVKTQNVQIAEMQPKVQYCDIVLSCPDLVTVTVIAKDYGKSAMWLNNYLKDNKIIFKQGDIWLPYQKYAKLGLTKTKTATYKDNKGNEHAKTHSYWTQKGRLFIYDLLKQDGILPLIEQE